MPDKFERFSALVSPQQYHGRITKWLVAPFNWCLQQGRGIYFSCAFLGCNNCSKNAFSFCSSLQWGMVYLKRRSRNAACEESTLFRSRFIFPSNCCPPFRNWLGRSRGRKMGNWSVTNIIFRLKNQGRENKIEIGYKNAPSSWTVNKISPHTKVMPPRHSREFVKENQCTKRGPFPDFWEKSQRELAKKFAQSDQPSSVQNPQAPTERRILPGPFKGFFFGVCKKHPFILQFGSPSRKLQRTRLEVAPLPHPGSHCRNWPL